MTMDCMSDEPGFEEEQGTPQGKAHSEEYNQNIYLNTMRWAMTDMIEVFIFLLNHDSVDS